MQIAACGLVAGLRVCWCLPFGGGRSWYFAGGWLILVLVVGLRVVGCLCVVLCFLFGLGCWFAAGCVGLGCYAWFCAGFHGALVCFGFSLILVCWLYLRGFAVLFVLRRVVLLLLVLVFRLGCSWVGYVVRGFCFVLRIVGLLWVAC